VKRRETTNSSDMPADSRHQAISVRKELVGIWLQASSLCRWLGLVEDAIMQRYMSIRQRSLHQTVMPPNIGGVEGETGQHLDRPG